MNDDEIAAVRARPGMYVGDDSGRGVLELVMEVVANAYDHYLAGRCSRIALEIAGDGTITVEDDGPGIAANGGDGVPPLHELLTHRSERPTVDGHRPHVHLGIGSVGLFVVNAVSEHFEVRTVRDGIEAAAAYAHGVVIEPMATWPASTGAVGTRIRFRPDPAIFKYPRVPRVELTRWLDDLGFLSPGLSLHWTIGGDDLAAGGLAARVALELTHDMHDIATHASSYETPSGPVTVTVAIGWRTAPFASGTATIESFVNLVRTSRHGSHVDGLLDGVRAFLGERDGRHGLVAAVSVVLSDVTYGQPDKTRLETADVRGPVALATKAALDAWSLRCPLQAAYVLSRSASPAL